MCSAVKSNLSNEPSNRLSDAELLDQLSSFLFAGSDSTALTITWCLYLLSQYPDVQTKLRSEIISAPVATDTSASKRNSTSSVSSTSSVMSVDAIDSLPFLDAVVRETLRVIPPVHGTGELRHPATMLGLNDNRFSARGHYRRLDPNFTPRCPAQRKNHPRE
jgi:cytochrome P450